MTGQLPPAGLTRQLLAGTGLGGVARGVVEPGELARVGWRAAVAAPAQTRTEALVAIGRALGFPDHYGTNLDALWDGLSELTEPTVLIWPGWSDLAAAVPQDWARVAGVLFQRAEQQPPPFAVLLS